jgi:hypothetical protein
MPRIKSTREVRKCKMCDTTFECLPTHTKKYCNKKCANADPEVKDKQRLALQQVWEEKYQGKHPMQLDAVKIKHKETMLKTYGVEHALQCNVLINKSNTTKLTRYGKLTNIEKIKQTKLRKYGNENYNGHQKRSVTKFKTIVDHWKHLTPLFTESEFAGVTKGQLYRFECKECKSQFERNLNNGYIPSCAICARKNSTYNNSSVGEREVIDFIRNVCDTEIIERDRSTLNGKELDIFLPKLKLAIEYNGIYWHSESKLQNKMYHLKKTEQCAIRGIQLIHIYDYQWHQKQEIIKSMLLSKLNKSNKIFARKCKIKQIKSNIKKDFLNSTHLQGNCNSSINLGLYHQSELVAVATFGKSRYDKKYEYELLRYSTKLNTTIVGGFSKLLKYFINEYSPKNILTYCDRNVSIGNLYIQTNFQLIDVLKPSYFYFNGVNVFSRELFQKHKLKNKLPIFNESLTEYENMQINGYDRVWDAGNYKFVLNCK